MASTQSEKHVLRTLKRLEKLRAKHGATWTEAERSAHAETVAEHRALLAQLHRDAYVRTHGHEPGEAPVRRKRDPRPGFVQDWAALARDGEGLWPTWTSTHTASSPSFSLITEEARARMSKRIAFTLSDETATPTERRLASDLQVLIKGYGELLTAVESMDGMSIKEVAKPEPETV